MSDALFRLWKPFSSFAFESYMKDGIEAPIFNQIGMNSKMAESFCRFSAQSDNYLERKVAASLAGYINNPNITLLSDMLELETKRDRSLPNDENERLGCQSVVEEVLTRQKHHKFEQNVMPICT